MGWKGKESDTQRDKAETYFISDLSNHIFLLIAIV